MTRTFADAPAGAQDALRGAYALSAAEFALAFGEIDAYYTRQLGDAQGRQWFALVKLREAGQAATRNWPAQRPGEMAG